MISVLFFRCHACIRTLAFTMTISLIRSLSFATLKSCSNLDRCNFLYFAAMTVFWRLSITYAQLSPVLSDGECVIAPHYMSKVANIPRLFGI